ncbi:MAG TPA: phage major capsid protein [Terriglobia bacterium]|nr:phage major capsid protein [Terriglobia bacterium]
MSNRLGALEERKGKLTDQLDVLHKSILDENREYTAEEKQAFEDIDAEIKKVDEAIEFEKRVEARKAATATRMNLPGNETRQAPASPKRSTYGRQLKAFKPKTFGTQADAEDAAYKSGMWCRAVIYGDEGAKQWCNEHDVEIRNELSYGAVSKSQNETVNSAGGYLVFPEMSTAIIDLREQYGTARKFLNVVPMASDSQLVPKRTGGLSGSFATEENAFTESSKSWSQVQLRAQALGCLTRISRELDQDAVISVADDIASEMAYGLAVKEDATLWNGDGTSSYGGITGVRTKFAAGVGVLAGAIDAASGHDTFAEYDANDLIKVIGALPKYAEPNAVWFGHRTAWANTFLRLLAAAGGNAIVDIQAGGKPQLGYLGYAFETDQTLPSALTDLSDTAVVLFGDLNAAVTMGERKGLTIDVDRSIYFLQRQIAIMGWERIDINVHDIGDNVNVGPLVALMAE